MGATDGASFPGQQSGPTQPVQVSKKTRVSPFIPPPPPPPPGWARGSFLVVSFLLI